MGRFDGPMWVIPESNETSRWFANNSAPLHAAIDRTLAHIRAVEMGAFPVRIMMGFDGSKSDDQLTVAWKDPAPLNKASLAGYIAQLDSYIGTLAHFYKTPHQHNNQEATMTIDKKDYVTQAVRTPAGSLAQRHIGSFVTITLPSGAEITDVLVGVASGRTRDNLSVGEHPGQDVEVKLANVGGVMTYDSFRNRDVAGAHVLGPKSVVLVRRPKPVTAAKKKTARR